MAILPAALKSEPRFIIHCSSQPRKANHAPVDLWWCWGRRWYRILSSVALYPATIFNGLKQVQELPLLAKRRDFQQYATICHQVVNVSRFWTFVCYITNGIVAKKCGKSTSTIRFPFLIEKRNGWTQFSVFLEISPVRTLCKQIDLRVDLFLRALLHPIWLVLI